MKHLSKRKTQLKLDHEVYRGLKFVSKSYLLIIKVFNFLLKNF